jgi:formylglycine-generating enzyme required for sulfatase activity
MLRLRSILRSLSVLLIMPAHAVLVAGESEKPKCEQCKPPSCVTQFLVANRAASGARTASDASDKQPAAATTNGPSGMVWIPAGEFTMGAATNGHGSGEMPMASNDAEPLHRVRVDGFWIDKTVVTNADFEKFVAATGYVTIAERAPSKEEYPTAPEENLVAGSVVFAPPDHEVPLTDHFQWWSYVKGANWRKPLGPQSDIKGKENIPLCTSRIRMRKRMQNGPENVCPLKPSLSSRHAAD